MLDIRVFGELRCAVAGEALTLPAAAATRRMWAYLLLHRHAPMPRRRVAHDVWPDTTESSALVNMRRRLHLLLRALPAPAEGRPWFVADRLTIQWNPGADYWLDVDAFEESCAATDARAPGQTRGDVSRLQSAMALYTGDLLSDLSNGWVLTERERLSELYSQGLHRLLGLLAEEGDFRAAASTAGRLVDHDEFREEAQRLQIGLLHLAGDRAAALKAYDGCKRVLAEAFGIEPMQATVSLADAVRSSAPPEDIVRTLSADLPAGIDLSLMPGRVRHNLPSQISRFIGRKQEMDDLARRLGATRLLTLTGPGGSGKTRLALEVAGRLATSTGRTSDQGARGLPWDPSFPSPADGVWWVDLAPLDTGALVPQAVGAVLGVGDRPGSILAEELAHHVRDKVLLLVLDNCEHLIAPVAELTGRLLRAAPGVRVMATSREALGLEGELTLPIPPLSVPPADGAQDGEDPMGYEAPQLFMDRARLVVPDFAEEATVVAEICRRLDGIPLAIELAAAGLRSLSATQIVERLDDRFQLLRGGSRTALPRHQTLAAAIDWSYDLLRDPERRLLDRLSVFRNGWTLPAAKAVCAGQTIQPPYVLTLLHGLVGKSLVMASTGDGGSRYRLLQTIRQYAHARLEDAGNLEPAATRHLHYFLALAEKAHARLGGPDQGAAMGILETELDNIRAALDWATRHGEAEAGLRLSTAMWRYWHDRGHWREGQTVLEGLLALPGADGDSAERADALRGLGNLQWAQGDYRGARSTHEEALSIRRRIGDEPGVAASLSNMGVAAWSEGDLETARSLHEESLDIRRRLGDRRRIAFSANNLGVVAEHQGRYAEARALYEEVLAIHQEMGDRAATAAPLSNLGDVAHNQGDDEAAHAYFTQSLAIDREHRNVDGIAMTLNNLGEVERGRGRYDVARALLEESLALRRDLGDKGGLAMTINSLGELEYDEGNYKAARSRFHESLVILHEIGGKQGIAYVLEDLAKLKAVQGRFRRAAWLLGSARSLRLAIGAPVPPAFRDMLEDVAQRARKGLGDDAFDALLAEGRRAALDEVVARVLGDPGAGPS